MKQLDYTPYALAAIYRYAPFNILGMAAFEGTIAVDAWQQAVRTVQNRHPFLNRRLTADYRLAPLPEPVPLLTSQQRSSADSWQQAARDRLNQRFDISSGPLLRFTLLQGEDQSEIILSGLHSVIDGASGLNLLHELLANVEALESGERLPYSEPLTELPELEDLLPPGYQRGQRMGKLLRYGAVQMVEELSTQMRNIGRPAVPAHQPSKTDFICFAIDSDLTIKLSRRARRERLTLHSVLNAAQMLAAHRLLHQKHRMLFQNIVFADLRPYLVPPVPVEQLGALIAMQRFTHVLHAERLLWELAHEVHDAIYQSSREGDKFLAYIMARPLMEMFLRVKKSRMGHSALSYPGVVPLAERYGALRVTDVRVMISQMWLNPAASSQVCLFGDRLLWTLIYPAQAMTRAQATSITEEITAILAAGV